MNIVQDPPCNCCPYVVTVELDINEIHDLHNNSITAITPPSGYAVKLVKPSIMWTNSDGTGFGFASGEFINIYNGATVMPILHQFTDPAVMQDGIYSSYFFQSYECVIDGDIRIGCTFPITGGGSNSYIKIQLIYELVQL